MLKKTINKSENNSEIISYKNLEGEAIDKIELFRIIKFITQTYKYYQKIPGIYLLEKKPSGIRSSKLFKNSINENKKVFYKIVERINKQQFLTKDVVLLYNLNRVYAEKILATIPKVGINGHEKIASIFIAQRNYSDKIIINKQIFNLAGHQVKEFDMLVIKTAASSNAWRGNILVEDKKMINRDCFEQVFGYHPSRKLKTAHKDILKNSSICRHNELPEINEIEILYSNIDSSLLGFKLGKKLAKKNSLELSIDELEKLTAEFINYRHSAKVTFDGRIKSFIEKNNKKYSFDLDNNLLILAGKMSTRERKQLLNIVLTVEEKENVNTLFSYSHFSNFKELKEQTAVRNIVFTRINITKKTLLKFFLDKEQQKKAEIFFSRI